MEKVCIDTIAISLQKAQKLSRIDDLEYIFWWSMPLSLR